MYHSERGWRKLVEWDNEHKEYKYKGYSILPLSYEEQITMPMHLQSDYYWNEIIRIDSMIKSKELDKNRLNSDKTAWEVLDDFYAELEEI